MIIPMMSDGIFPSQNLPVGIPPSKFLPQGGKLHLAIVLRQLLLPASTMESPKNRSAGTVTFGGSFCKELTVQTIERKSTNVEQKQEDIILIFNSSIPPCNQVNEREESKMFRISNVSCLVCLYRDGRWSSSRIYISNHFGRIRMA